MEILHLKKPILIGVLHLPSLPGSPKFESNPDFMNNLIEFAVRNVKRFEEGDVDAVIIENFNDNPFNKKVNDVRTISAFTIIVHEVIKNTSLPIGINLLRNSCPEAATIAIITGASFIRCNAYCETIVCPEGIIEPCAREVQEVFQYFKKKVPVFADILVKHASPLHKISIEDLVKDYEERCLADALIVTGERTGKPPNPNFVNEVLKNTKLPVFIGSGITPENIHLYKNVSGYIVGTYFKNEKGEIDIEKVKILVQRVKELKNSNSRSE